jgi:hypothetical protein
MSDLATNRDIYGQINFRGKHIKQYQHYIMESVRVNSSKLKKYAIHRKDSNVFLTCNYNSKTNNIITWTPTPAKVRM